MMAALEQKTETPAGADQASSDKPQTQTLQRLASLFAGLLFGAGLVVAGMTKPEKVAGFLDFFGRWDASLALVMAAAVGVHAPLMRLVTRRKSPLFDVKFHLPTRRDIDARLVVGAVLFGAGWGLGGFCPGPGLVSLGAGSGTALVFVVAMTAGMLIEEKLIDGK